MIGTVSSSWLLTLPDLEMYRGWWGAGQQKLLTDFERRRIELVDDEIDYEELVQEGLRLVVKEALVRVAEEGPIGLHHFYISFRTDFPGVEISDSLRKSHPEEMTIVLQHQYWDLEVTEEYFAVTLSFNEAHERIKVPFIAILSFMDPSVKFGLQFTPPPVYVEDKTPKSLEGPSKVETDDGEKKDNVVTLDAFRNNNKNP